MVRRHAKSGFMAGAHVFPGGKLDATDAAPDLIALTTGRARDEAAHVLGESVDGAKALSLFVAAVRETFEEAGVLLADVPNPTRLEDARARLEAGTPFVEVVASLGATLRLDWLVPQARWITPEVEPRRFDARFFLARAPSTQRAEHDRRETTEAAWMTPAHALERERLGGITLPPPTLRTLECLSAFDRAEDALADAASRPPPLVRPVFRQEQETVMLCLPGDPGHPEDAPVLPGPTRFVLARGRFWSGDPPAS